MTRPRLLLAFAALATLTPPAHADDPFYLKDGDRVVFYGDSITDQRLYTTFVESFVVTRYPERKISFVHSGWGGDRVGGGGGGSIDRRLYRDVIAYRPTVVTIMLGMNDASYRPFDEKIFETYQKGYEHIVATLKRELPGVRITLIQPSPFDDVTRKPNFEGGYNEVLVRYGAFVKDLAGREGLHVADLNTSVVDALKKANEADSEGAQKLIPDRVHPGPAGHLLMAAALLKAWHAPELVSRLELDATGEEIDFEEEGASVLAVGDEDGKLTWTQLDDALPLPLDPKDATIALALRSSDVLDGLDRQILRATGLKAEEYTLKVDDQRVGSFPRAKLVEGLNLAALDTPMSRQARDVHALTLRHNNLHFARWRNVQVPFQDEPSPNLLRALADLDALEAELVDKQRALAQPKEHEFELVPKR